VEVSWINHGQVMEQLGLEMDQPQINHGSIIGYESNHAFWINYLFAVDEQLIDHGSIMD